MWHFWRKRQGWEGEHCATGVSVWMGRLAFLCWFLCNLRVHMGLKNDVIISKESERIWFPVTYFKIQLVHFHIDALYSPCTHTENLKTTRTATLRMENWSPTRNPYLMLGRRVAAGGGGESREEHHIPHFPGGPLEKTWKEIKGLA